MSQDRSDRDLSKFHGFLPESLAAFWRWMWRGHWTRAHFPAHFIPGLIGAPALYAAIVYIPWTPARIAFAAVTVGAAWREEWQIEVWPGIQFWKSVADTMFTGLGAALGLKLLLWALERGL